MEEELKVRAWIYRPEGWKETESRLSRDVEDLDGWDAALLAAGYLAWAGTSLGDWEDGAQLALRVHYPKNITGRDMDFPYLALMTTPCGMEEIYLPNFPSLLEFLAKTAPLVDCAMRSKTPAEAPS